ncbi:MAG TPA: PQQ-like beta-propeller repeat protein [Candidatus Agrococcus pullicola]|uniref:PQQ-like beta-propeller repeat protein n=1 Tax=Candidatus Agrococcus pullicola TaxID=2838429 RepID=A0A9D2C9U8_9MICO|nr:PQQ-like beta-propeller repeat protein [Candidatus Agrococcus pullicola]
MAALCVCLTATLVAACSQDDSAIDPDATPSSQQPVITAEAEAFSVTEDPLWAWDNETAPALISDVIFLDELALAVGGTSQFGKSEFSVVDAETGEPLWSMAELADIEGLDAAFYSYSGLALTGEEGQELIVVSYYSPDCVTAPCPPSGQQSPETGIVALDLRTGEPQWTYAAIPSVNEVEEPKLAQEHRDSALHILEGHQETPLITIGPVMGLNGQQVADPDLFRTVALSPDTGEELWTAPAVIANRVVDDRLISLQPPESVSDGRFTHGAGGPVAIDMATGEQVWNASEQFPLAQLEGAGDGRAIFLDVTQDSGAQYNVIDLADGALLHTVDDIASTPVMDPVTGMIGYRSLDSLDALTTLLAEEDEWSLSGVELDQEAGIPALAHDEYMFLYNHANDTTTVVDRSGTQHGIPLEGRVISVTEDHVVTQQGAAEDASITVYARTQ